MITSIVKYLWVLEFAVFLSPYLAVFFRAFLLTVFIEFLVFYPFAREIGIRKALGAVLLVNAFSLPVVWFVLSILIRDSLAYALSAELFAIFSESSILKVLLPISYKRILLAALTMNVVSFLIGWAVPSLIGQ